MIKKGELDFLGVIPARAGSKGVLRKNIRPLVGKPLIAWTIEQALASKYLSKVIVSTDSEEIADIARSYGAEAPFLRPADLAGDATPTWPVLRHAVEEMEGREAGKVKSVVLLQPTSPLRKKDDIDKCIELFKENPCHAVYSVCVAEDNPYFNMLELDSDGYARLCKKIDPPPLRRQDVPKVYVINGAVYVYERDVFFTHANSVSLDRIFPYIMPKERSLDIDSMEDFEMADRILRTNPHF